MTSCARRVVVSAWDTVTVWCASVGHSDCVVCVCGTLCCGISIQPLLHSCPKVVAVVLLPQIYPTIMFFGLFKLRSDINIIPESEENSVVSDITKDLQTVSHIFRFQLT